METLAPRELYDHDEIGIGERLPLYSGVFFGLAMALFALIDDLQQKTPILTALLGALIIGGGAGAAFGLLLPWGLGRMARGVNDKLYAGDLALISPPPPSEEYSYRLPCGWMRTPTHAVNGVLYVGRRGLRFDPLLRTPARYRSSFVLEPLERLRVEVVEAPLPPVARIWGRRSVQRIRVHGERAGAEFTIPRAPEIADRLRDRMARLRRGLGPATQTASAAPPA